MPQQYKTLDNLITQQMVVHPMRKYHFSLFYFRISRLIQSVACHFFVIICEIYLQFLSANCLKVFSVFSEFILY